jgi:tetratricopeptide (TPR) repeat protein
MSVAEELRNSADILFELGRPREALARLERARAIATATLGPEHSLVGVCLTGIAQAQRQLGSDGPALRSATLALRLLETANGPHHPTVAYALIQVGNSAAASRRLEPAISALERAVSMLEPPADDPTGLLEARFSLARALYAGERDRVRAIELARRALATARELGGNATDDAVEIERWLRARGATA